MAGRILTDDGGRALDSNASPISGGKRKAFIAGTATPVTLYTTSALNVAHASPVVANSAGFFPQMWAAETLLLDIKDYAAADVTYATPLRTYPNVTPQGPEGGNFRQAGAGSTTRTIQAKLLELPVSLLDARQSNDDDDNNALASLLGDGYRNILLPAAKGFGDSGDWLLGSSGGSETALQSGTRLIGDGRGRTIVRRAPGFEDHLMFYINSGSEDPEDNIKNVLFQSMTLADDPALGFKNNAVMILGMGVTGLTVFDMGVEGCRSDFVCLEAVDANDSFSERHNRAFTAFLCHIDGLNNNNRNAFTLNDFDGAYLGAIFGRNFGRPGDGTEDDPDGETTATAGLGMPGFLDVEPSAEATNPIARGLDVNGMFLDSCKGINGAISLLLKPNSAIATPHKGFKFSNVRMRDCPEGYDFSGYASDDALTATHGYDIHVDETCSIHGATNWPWRMRGMLDVRMRAVIEDSAGSAYIGYSGDARANHRIKIGNTMRRVGTTTGIGIVVNGSTGTVDIEGGEYVDVGKSDGTAGNVLYHTTGTAMRLSFRHNIVSSPAGKTKQICTVVGGSITNATCQNHSNQIDFTPTTPDSFNPLGIEDGWVVVAAGSGGSVADGAVTSWAVTVTGARMGDIPSTVINSAVPGLHLLSARMFADDTVQAILLNKSGFSIDTTAYTFTTQVIRKPGR